MYTLKDKRHYNLKSSSVTKVTLLNDTKLGQYKAWTH